MILAFTFAFLKSAQILFRAPRPAKALLDSAHFLDSAHALNITAPLPATIGPKSTYAKNCPLGKLTATITRPTPSSADMSFFDDKRLYYRSCA